MHQSTDPYYLEIKAKTSGQILGSFALMRIDRHNRTLEMGWVVYSTALQRTRMATEAQYLVMKYVFETLGYRRYEWKCDALNAPSRHAAERLGFRYEGTFRQMQVYKNRTRDTAWFSLLDHEWHANKIRLERWLDKANFDQNGRQIEPLQGVGF
ncbi:GNAT family N-acetyltransferase [Haemophilus paracuniculus]|uniref:GNAT family N-acetyltransferase n=2 Tax=Haemophilus paracuniculus TaxID=734 RepID=A0A1T0ATM2_9PAST|nr:GNAT family N-acetyltransferase [Haemophilus paracuniculus]